MTDKRKYKLRFFFEWGGGCLWPDSDDTYRDFDFGPYDILAPCPLKLSAATLESCRRMAEWHDTSLNWDYPPDPGPWRQPECDRFNEAVRHLLETLRAELSDQFEVVSTQAQVTEDPDLDTYLADPKWFRRRPT